MYRLRYQQLETYAKRFGGQIRISGGDTDSFFLKVINIDLEKELLPAMENDDLLDSSNYPVTHPLYSSRNKARLGCIKDESCGQLYKDWVFLRPKCYSLLTVDGDAHKRAKGVQRSVVKKEIEHSNYLEVFETGTSVARTVVSFQSKNHQLSTVSSRKRALSLFEDKRAWVDQNTSYAYGHWRLEKRAHFQ